MTPVRVTISSLLLLLTVAGCGSVEILTPDEAGASAPTPSESAGEADSRAFVFATDYQSSGQIYSVTLDGENVTLANTGLVYLGSSAVIRTYGGLLYILHDGFSTVSSDNLQIVDPADAFATLGQYSTGNGSNPHDVVVTDSRAFIALYNPAADADNITTDGLPGDVIEMDTTSGDIINRWSFQPYLADDGDLNANAEQMVLANGILYIALQDLESDTFHATTNGKIGMIDTTTNEIVGVIPLQGRNPMGMAVSGDGAWLAVATMATYDTTLGDFDTATPYGGWELVNLVTRATELFLDDDELGGYVERVEADGDVAPQGAPTTFYTVVSAFAPAEFTYTSKLLRITVNTDDSTLSLRLLEDVGTDIREIAVDNGVLWVSRRRISTADGLSEPVIEPIDPASGELLGNEVIPVAPGMSMVGAE